MRRASPRRDEPAVASDNTPAHRQLQALGLEFSRESDAPANPPANGDQPLEIKTWKPVTAPRELLLVRNAHRHRIRPIVPLSVPPTYQSRRCSNKFPHGC